MRHTREDAIDSCQESGILPVQQVSEDCIRQELAKRASDVVTADRERGEFRDYYGDRFRVSLNTSQAYPASLFKANITNLATGKPFDRVMADSKAHQPMPVYRDYAPPTRRSGNRGSNFPTHCSVSRLRACRRDRCPAGSRR